MKTFSVKRFMYQTDKVTNVTTRIVESVKENIPWLEAKELRKTDTNYWITNYNFLASSQNIIWKV